MKTAVVALTKRGAQLAGNIGLELSADIYVKQEFTGEAYRNGASVKAVNDNFTGFVGTLFSTYDALVFVMACGIVVRSIAPYIRSKTTDPAVVVMDEMGKYAISLLSGHVGGANRLAARVAELAGGLPVITTATDVNGVTAFDVFASENNCAIENMGDLKYISGELVNGGVVALYSNHAFKGDMPSNIIPYGDEGFDRCRYVVAVASDRDIRLTCEKLLVIRPKSLILGIGCRKGIAVEQLATAVEDFMVMNNKSILSIKCAATIDLKENEEGIKSFCSRYGIPLRIISRESIKAAGGDFTHSDFVQSNVGVGSVSEPCAVLGGHNTALICKKTVYKGITLALAEEEKVFYL